jgi:hypothetical protein
MTRKFIGLVLATSLTITTIGAAPARADNVDDVATVLGVAATLFVLGKALEDSGKSSTTQKQYVHSAPQTTYKPKQHNSWQPPKSEAKPWNQPTKYRSKPPLPAGCAIRVRGQNTRYALGEKCLRTHYQSARPLPRECKIRITNPSRPGYSLRCLRENGYELNQTPRH